VLEDSGPYGLPFLHIPAEKRDSLKIPGLIREKASDHLGEKVDVASHRTLCLSHFQFSKGEEKLRGGDLGV